MDCFVGGINVPAVNFQLSHLTSAIDSHQSADRSCFLPASSVGMKEAYFFSPLQSRNRIFLCLFRQMLARQLPVEPGFFFENARGREVTRNSFNKNYSKLVITHTNGDADISISLHLLWVSAIGFTALTIKIQHMRIRCSNHVMDTQMVSLRTAWKDMNYSPRDCSGWRKKKKSSCQQDMPNKMGLGILSVSYQQASISIAGNGYAIVPCLLVDVSI